MSELFAYIDPATGAMILQVIAAAFLGATIVFRRICVSPFAFLINLLRKADSKSDSDDLPK